MTQLAGGDSSPPVIFLACHCHDWRVHAHLLDSMLASQLACLREGIAIIPHLRVGECHVDDAKNAFVEAFLKSDATHLFIVGQDQGWRGADFLKLCKHDRDIVAAGWIKKQPEEAYTVLLDTDEIHSDADGLVEVLAVGDGFMKISRAVMETLARDAVSYSPDKHPEISIPIIFERIMRGGRRWSGDNVFCLKAREAGFKIYVDPDIYCEHIGQHLWRGHLGNFWLKGSE